jgi:hypothetical protein
MLQPLPAINHEKRFSFSNIWYMVNGDMLDGIPNTDCPQNEVD